MNAKIRIFSISAKFSARRSDGFAIRRKKRFDLLSRGICNPLSHRYADYCLRAGDKISPEHKEVRSVFDGGLQIRRNA